MHNATDHRTSYAAGLDAAAAWLAERLPDRVPDRTPIELLADPSRLAALATELARRYHHRYVGRPGYGKLRTLIDALPKSLRDTRLTESAIRDELAAIGVVLETLDAPPRPREPVTPLVAELARDLGVDVAADVAAAREQLAAAAALANTGDRRAAPLWSALFFAAAGQLEASAEQLARWRFALVGYGLPKVRSADVVFGRVARTTLAPPRPDAGDTDDFLAHAVYPSAIEVFHRLAADAGLDVPKPAPAAEAAERKANAARFELVLKEITERHRAARKAAVFVGDRDQSHRDEAREIEAAQQAMRERAALIGREFLSARRVATIGVVADIDRRLDAFPAAQVGSLGYYWLRELRRRVARSSDDRPDVPLPGLNDDDAMAQAFEFCRSLGVW